jgi:hypothetical protein
MKRKDSEWIFTEARKMKNIFKHLPILLTICIVGCFLLIGCCQKTTESTTEKKITNTDANNIVQETEVYPSPSANESLETRTVGIEEKERDLKHLIQQDIPVDYSSANEIVTYFDGWVYCGHKNMFRMRPDGSEREKLADISGVSISVTSEGVFFIKRPVGEGTDFFIYRMAHDGSNLKQLNRQFSFDLNVSECWLFYTAPPDFGLGTGPNHSIYRMKLDGTQKEQLSIDVGVMHLNAIEGWLYYTCGQKEANSSNGKDLLRMRLDGSDREVVFNNVRAYLYEDGWLYIDLEGNGNQQGRIRLDGSQFEEYHIEGYLINGWCIYTKNILGYKCYAKPMNGKDNFKICDMENHPGSMSVAGGYLYFYIGYKLYRVLLTGGIAMEVN